MTHADPKTLLLPDDPGADLYRVRAGVGKNERVLLGSELIAGIVVAETAMLNLQQHVRNRTLLIAPVYAKRCRVGKCGKRISPHYAKAGRQTIAPHYSAAPDHSVCSNFRTGEQRIAPDHPVSPYDAVAPNNAQCFDEIGLLGDGIKGERRRQRTKRRDIGVVQCSENVQVPCAMRENVALQAE